MKPFKLKTIFEEVGIGNDIAFAGGHIGPNIYALRRGASRKYDIKTKIKMSRI